MHFEQLSSYISNGQLDAKFSILYGEDRSELDQQRRKYLETIANFQKVFVDSLDIEKEIRLLSVPGRSEIGGNHTDHNHGRVLACAVNLDIIAVVSKNDSGRIRIKSEGFDMDFVEIKDVTPKENEHFKSSALIRGILSRLIELGYETGNGFDAYTTSRVPKGSGLSSSAAFEVMVASIFSNLYNAGKIDPVVMAQVSQYAESEFFGKPCGLMDQLACTIGGFISINFADPAIPVIEKIEYDLSSADCKLCIVNTSGNHAGLNEDYASIQDEMKHVARTLGHHYLGECDKTEFYSKIDSLRKKLSDRELLRAIHFFSENARVEQQVKALKAGNFELFKHLIVESGRSSFMYLQNCYSISSPSEQGISLALALSERLLDGYGAWRVHGGGFAGTIQAFVPNEKVEQYIAAMDKVFGEKKCNCLYVRSIGACCIL